MRDGDCPFCEVVRRTDRDAREVYRDAEAVAFFPTEPATIDHTLLVPRLHVPDIWTLPEDVAAHLGKVTVRLASAVKRAVKPDGLNIIQSNGSAATQTVFHLHVHLVPRWENDAVGRIWPPGTDYTDKQKDDAWERLKAECRRIEVQ